MIPIISLHSIISQGLLDSYFYYITLLVCFMKVAHQLPKSPLLLLLLISLLIISSLVVATEYFLRPSIETEISNKVVSTLSHLGLHNTLISVSGRDVTLVGYVENKEEIIKALSRTQAIDGVREVTHQLVIKR